MNRTLRKPTTRSPEALLNALTSAPYRSRTLSGCGRLSRCLRDAGILYLSPKATLARLTRHRFKHAFRLVPSDDAFAETRRLYEASRLEPHRVVYARFEQGEALARESAHLRKAWAMQSPDKAMMAKRR